MFSSHSHHAHHPPLDSPSDVPASPSVDHPDLGGGGLGWAEVFTPELRAKIVRLEKENEILKRRLETEDDTESPIVGPGMCCLPVSPLPLHTLSHRHSLIAHLHTITAGDDGLRTKVAEQLLTIKRLEREVEDRNHRLSRLEVASNNGNYLTSAISRSIRARGRPFLISSDKMADQRPRKEYVPRQAQKDPHEKPLGRS